MASTSFTFLNTDGPRLSKAQAKRMRGHVTKTNFASRRVRRANVTSTRAVQDQTSAVVGDDKEHQGLSYAPHALQPSVGPDLALAFSAATSQASAAVSAQLLADLWSTFFLSGDDAQADIEDLRLLDNLSAEPAFMEATMVIAIRYWSPDVSCKVRADQHSHRALQLIMDRIGSRRTFTDGFLLAAMVMALGEHLMQNIDAWEIHINGVVDAIRARRAKNLESIPQVVADFLIMDSTNDIFRYSRVYHQKIVDEAVGHQDKTISVLAALSRDLTALRKWVNEQTSRCPAGGDPPAIQELWIKSYLQTKRLQDHSSPYVRAALKAAQVILYLSSPPDVDTSFLPLLADELKQAMSQFPGRSCWCLELTSCQLMVGAIASAKGSEARAYFVGKLKRSVGFMRARGWDNPFVVSERAFATDADMLQRLKAVWKEENSVEMGLTCLEVGGMTVSAEKSCKL